MAATHPHGPDFISEEKVAESDNMKGQPLPVKDEGAIPPNASGDTATIGHPRNSAGHLGNFGLGGDHTLYSPNIYAPQANTIFYRGYDNGVNDWEEYPTYLNADGLEIRSPGVYNENPSLVFHSGYGYNPQMPYGPYSPVTTPLPSVGGDGQLYSPQQFPYSGTPYYQQLGPSSTPFIPSQTPVSQPELANVLSVDRQGDNMFVGPRPGYPPVGSFGRGNFPDNSSSLGFHDVQHEFDGLRSGGLWSDWSKPSDRQRPLSHFTPAASPQPTHPIGSFGQNVGISSQQQRSPYGFGFGSNYYNRDYLPGGFSQGNSPGNVSFSSLGANSQGWLSLENSRRRPRGGGSLCSCNSTHDILNEQNRGPRALKPKIQIMNDGSTVEKNKHNLSTALVQNESYNNSDFLTEYKDAKFFIIKSYSEDNVHKSIKYGVWASTPNGNKKLDAAYLEANEKQDTCPVFLLFSVNASAQFCGVAEMIGSVDFDKSVDYWQQDKWCGQFPVKWHIIKDVPNSQFRHIILESNDNKPVTNSRDTQEVILEHGIEMLKIFKNYESDMSILDDFDFYEERQKAMQERKARQQASLVAVGLVNEDENRGPVTLPTDFIKQMSKSFAQVVCLDEGSKEALTVNASSVNDVSMGSRLKLEDAITGAVVTSGQTS